MANVYTFPTYHLPAGDVVIVISIFDGTTVAHSPAEKYFTKIGTIKRNIELEGGDLQVDVVDFEIEYDVSNLFSETIYNSLVAGNRALLTMTLGGSVIFIGVINEDSFNNEDWYSTTEDMSTTKRRVTFNVRWILDVLQDYLPTSAILSFTTTLTLGGTELVSLYYLIVGLLYPLNAIYGFTVNVIDNISNLGLVSPAWTGDSFSSGGQLTPIPSNLAMAGATFLQTACIMVGFNPGTGLQYNYLFNPQGSDYPTGNNSQFTTLYDFITGLIQAFGFIVRVTYVNASEINVIITDRLSGASIVPYPNVLQNRNEDVFLELRDSIDITSSVNNNEIKLSPNMRFFSTFSFNTQFDINQNAYNAATSLGQLRTQEVALNGKTFTGLESQYIQYILDTSLNLISNSEFLSNITGWNIIAGSWAWSNSPTYNASPASNGCLQLTVTANGTYTIEYVFGSTQTLSSVFLFWMDYSGSLNGATVTAEATFYMGSNYAAGGGASMTPPTDWRLFTGFFDSGTVFSTAPGVATFDRVRIIVVVSGGASPSFDLNFDNAMCFHAFSNVPRFLGARIAAYFTTKGMKKNVRTIDGIQQIFPADYYSYNSDTFYCKMSEWDLYKNETNLEAINY